MKRKGITKEGRHPLIAGGRYNLKILMISYLYC